MAENSNKTAKYEIIVDTSNGKVKIDGITKGFVEANTAFKNLDNTIQKTTKDGLNPLINKSGLAGAAVQEMGRTISDSNYGIQGMANNLSQLGSLFTNLITTTGGFVNAIKAMWAAMAGPLGIIIIFQTLLAVFEGISLRARGAEKAIDSLTKVTVNAGSQLKVTLEALKDYQVSLEQKEKILKDVENATGLMNLKLNEQGVLTWESVEAMEAEIKTLEKVARAKEFVGQLMDLEIQKRELENKGWEDQIGWMSKIFITKDIRESLGKERLVLALEEVDNKIKDIKKTMGDEGLFEEIFPDEKDKKGKKDKEVEKVLEKYANTLEQGIQRMGLEKKEDPTFIDLMIGNTEEQLKESVKNTLDGLKRVAEDPDLSKYIEELRQERLAQMQEYAMQFGDVMNGLADFMDADFKRQITLEQNKTNELNNELRLRLDNEKLSAEERASIQNQIYQNDEKLRKRQEQIEEKRFKMNKAANIANAVINTFLAATGVLAQTNGGPIARIVAMTAVISAGLLQVAAIAKQKFQTSASSAPPSLGGSAGGSSSQQAPDFNIVGSSGVNQLRTAIEGQLNRPIKTYVTTKDVSTGQELDRNIVQGATFGN